MRPTKFDTEKGKQICGLLAGGNFLTDAAALVGVDVRTVERWIERGTQGQKIYAEFAQEVAKARAQFVASTIIKIRRQDGDWRAHAWILEKLRPRQFGQQIRLHVDQEQREFLTRLERALPPDVFEKVLSVAASDVGGGEAPIASGGTPTIQ